MNSLKIFSINILVLFALLLLIELIFGGWFYEKNKLNNLGIVRNVELNYSLEDLYYDSGEQISYTRDFYGLRGRSSFNNPQKICILTIGGSTTDQRYMDDKNTWQEVLERRFKENNRDCIISNAGMDGQSTFGHIKNFEIWFPNIPDLQPKYILFYIGINDLFKVLASPRFDDIDYEDNTIQLIKAQIKNYSSLYNLYRKIKGTLDTQAAGAGHEKIDFLDLSYTEKGIADKELIELFKKESLGNFKNRLSKLIHLTQRMGAEPIFVTQPSRMYKFMDEKLLGASTTGTAYGYVYNGVDYYHFISELNDIIYEVAGDEFIVVDLTSLPIWKDSDFYDFSHMTSTGASKLGNELFIQLNTKLK